MKHMGMHFFKYNDHFVGSRYRSLLRLRLGRMTSGSIANKY